MLFSIYSASPPPLELIKIDKRDVPFKEDLVSSQDCEASRRYANMLTRRNTIRTG